MKGGFLVKYNEVVGKNNELEKRLKELESEFILQLSFHFT